MRRLSLCAVILAAAVSANCTTSAGEEQPKRSSSAITPSPPRKPEPVPSSAPPSGKLVTAEVPPDLIEKMRADLAEHAGIAASAAKVVVAESITWPNGAMGCAEPGQMYTQATIPGYRVEFEHEGRTYSYHAAQRGGFFKLCENSRHVPGADVR